MIKPVNYRDLVFNIIEKEYERLEISPVNEIVVDNMAHISWDITDNISDLCKILENDLYSLYDGRIVKEFHIWDVCEEISNAPLYATYCSV